jgi:hypothetical protein
VPDIHLAGDKQPGLTFPTFLNLSLDLMSQISVFTFDFGAGDERQDLERNRKEQ